MRKPLSMLAALVMSAIAATASAGHKVVVIRPDSSADWATRSQIESTVLGFARHVDRVAGKTDVTYDELAAAAGCNGDTPTCRDAILDALAVDEIVLITITPAGADAKVTVRRATKGNVRTASAIVSTSDPERPMLATIGPLFGVTRADQVPAAPIAKAPAPAKDPAAPRVTTPPTATSEPSPIEPSPPSPAPSPPVATAPAAGPAMPLASKPEPADARRDDRGGRDRPAIGGMVGGGALAVIGFALWAHANDLDNQIHRAPLRTSADLTRVRALESSGDHYATGGNVLVVAGVAIAGVSGYLFWRSRHAHRDGTQARIIPVVTGNGFALTLSLEGAR